MSLWHQKPTIEQLNKHRNKNLSQHVGIEFTEIGPDFLTAKMPVDERTKQPFGILHGGASCVLAETVGSVAANLAIDPRQYRAVGLEINANHVRSANEGYVYGTAKALHLGKTTQIWEIQITNGAGQLTCISRLTMYVVKMSSTPVGVLN